MADINTGGAAFPCEGGSDSGLFADPGMSLRDYFAASALSQAVLDYDRIEQHPKDNHKNPLLPYATKGAGRRENIIARQAYRYADAMIAAREGGAS